MSNRYFGDGNFKAEVLADIRMAAGHYDKTPEQVVDELCEVLRYLCFAALNENDALARAKAEGKEEAKQELLEKVKRL